MKIQHFIMLVGLPASGKTTYAKRVVKNNTNFVHISSDVIREELFNNVNDQRHQNIVFETMLNKTREVLNTGGSVIYDATNIQRKFRMSTLQQLHKYRDNVKFTAVVFVRPFGTLIDADNKRKRTVGVEVLNKMLQKWETPSTHEGFDSVGLMFPDGVEPNREYFKNVVKLTKGFNQKNSFHTYDVYQHNEATALRLFETHDADLILAGKYHDIGKIFTQSFVDSKGNVTENAHYYNHHNVSAYIVLGSGVTGALQVSSLINLHMELYNKDENRINKLYKIFGEEVMKQLKLLHEADKNSH